MRKSERCLVQILNIDTANLLRRGKRIPMRLALLVAPDIKQLHANKQGDIASTETHQGLVSCVVCNKSKNKSAPSVGLLESVG